MGVRVGVMVGVDVLVIDGGVAVAGVSDSNAPMSQCRSLRPGDAALVGGLAGRVVAGFERRAAGKQCVREGASAVVRQRPEIGRQAGKIARSGKRAGSSHRRGCSRGRSRHPPQLPPVFSARMVFST